MPLKIFDPNDEVQTARFARARSRSVMIATPVARAPCWQYTVSLCDTCVLLTRLGITYIRQFVIGSSNLPRARNELCARFLASPCTDLLFIDDDMEWSPDSVVRLLASDKPIAGAIGRKRIDKANSDPDVWCGSPDVGPGNNLTQDDMGFIRLTKIGTGFLKIAREALLDLAAANPDWKASGKEDLPTDVKANYYRFFRFGDDELETSEDYVFCDAWRAHGGEIWADPEMVLGHIGEKKYSGSISELFAPSAAKSIG
jgi:hypothetical protein